MAWSRGSRSCAYMSIQAPSAGGKLVRRQGRSPPRSSSRAGARPPRAVLAAGASRRSAQAQCSCRRILEGGQEDRLQNVFNGEGTEEDHGVYHPWSVCVRRGAWPWGGLRGACPWKPCIFLVRHVAVAASKTGRSMPAPLRVRAKARRSQEALVGLARPRGTYK